MDAKIKEKYNRTKGGRTEDGKKMRKKETRVLTQTHNTPDRCDSARNFLAIFLLFRKKKGIIIFPLHTSFTDTRGRH
jgi:hypothetical protein